MDIKSIARINKDLIKEDGSIKSFQEQLLEYKYERFPKRTPLVVSATSKIIGIEALSDIPIIINPATISKIEEKHGIEVDTIIRLEEHLKNHVLAFESMTVSDALVLVFDQKDNANRQVICALHKNVRNAHMEVNIVKSLYGRENITSMISNTYQRGKSFFSNKKTNDWIKSVGVQFPKEVINHLFLINDTKRPPKSQEETSKMHQKSSETIAYKGPKL